MLLLAPHAVSRYSSTLRKAVRQQKEGTVYKTCVKSWFYRRDAILTGRSEVDLYNN